MANSSRVYQISVSVQIWQVARKLKTRLSRSIDLIFRSHQRRSCLNLALCIKWLRVRFWYLGIWHNTTFFKVLTQMNISLYITRSHQDVFIPLFCLPLLKSESSVAAIAVTLCSWPPLLFAETLGVLLNFHGSRPHHLSYEVTQYFPRVVYRSTRNCFRSKCSSNMGSRRERWLLRSGWEVPDHSLDYQCQCVTNKLGDVYRKDEKQSARQWCGHRGGFTRKDTISATSVAQMHEYDSRKKYSYYLMFSLLKSLIFLSIATAAALRSLVPKC